MSTAWHNQSAADALAELGVDPALGLSSAEAEERLLVTGPNELVERGGRSPWRILWEQITATMVLILLAAAGVSALLQKWQEAAAILAIVLLFALLGFVQEFRAERAMAALRRMAVPSVRVRRDGRIHEIPARNLAPGDIVLLEAGNVTPADLRLIETANLRIQEAALTGESAAIEKEVAPLDQADLPLGDRRNMAYLGTVVTYGRGAGVVTATGMQTELGRIAGLLQNVAAEMTPLQRRLDRVGRQLAVAGVILAVGVAAIGWLRGESLLDMFLVGVSIAVAVVPEGLPAVVTITLALGAQRMLARQALIRRLPAVETLGSVTVICSDKTGTLTENRMTVTVLDVAGQRIGVEETLNLADEAGATMTSAQAVPHPGIRLLLVGGALASDAQLVSDADGAEQRLHAIGDPTEGALVVAAARCGIWPAQLNADLPRLAEIPFDSDRKRMTTVHRVGQGLPPELAGGAAIQFTKGAVDGLLEISTQVWNQDHAEPMTPAWRQRIEAANRSLAENGMRVLGLAVRSLAAAEPAEHDLIFAGMIGLIDPPRQEVKEAVATCRAAGIRPVMITGDHPLTALHIARELGIADGQGEVLTGVELDRLSPAQFDSVVNRVAVFARVSPEHKIKIVEALQRCGQVVAMTGDGVNDAPALKQANIGVAMGITGTDVAKEAAAMVLRDDNFATIVAAVEEGRVIYDNLRKFIKFSLAGNIGKIGVMLGGVLIGMPIPLLPLQLLWLNLLTDGLLGVGLGLEPAERNVMRRQPISPQAGIFSDGMGAHIVRMGILIGAIALAVGAAYFWIGSPAWQTMIFTTLAFAQVWQALGVRSGADSLVRAGLLSNPTLLGLALLTVALQLAALYVPLLQNYLDTVPLAPVDLLVTAAAGSLVLVAAEVEKRFAPRTALNVG